MKIRKKPLVVRLPLYQPDRPLDHVWLPERDAADAQVWQLDGLLVDRMAAYTTRIKHIIRWAGFVAGGIPPVVSVERPGRARSAEAQIMWAFFRAASEEARQLDCRVIEVSPQAGKLLLAGKHDADKNQMWQVASALHHLDAADPALDSADQPADWQALPRWAS